MLNANSEENRCPPANCKVSLNKNEKPNPWISPKPKVTIQRCPNLAPTIFSNAIYTIDKAIKVSIRGGNHRAFGATPNDALIRVIE